MRALRGALVVAVLLGAVAPTAVGARSGTFTEHHFEAADPRDSRDYWVYVPASLPTRGKVPLVVYLHGCTQDGPDAAVGTRWNELAERHGFVVAYPEQRNPNVEDPVGPERIQGYLFSGNGMMCWNWFRPEHIRRGAGEAATIAGITRAVRRSHPIHHRRVFIAGASAGANMAAALAVAYPELYAAVGLASTCPFPLCADASGATAAALMGERARRMPAIVTHGTADHLVPFPFGIASAHQWLGTNDAIDNGALDGSVPRTPEASEDRGLGPEALHPGTFGDNCVRPSRWPCVGGIVGFQGSYPTTVQRYGDGCSLLDLWLIHGAGHAYTGGHPEASFTDPLGPNLSELMLAFFLAHPRGGSC